MLTNTGMSRIDVKSAEGIEGILIEYGVCGDIRYGAVLGDCCLCLAIGYDCFFSEG
jgi:hypothetical protein